MRLSSVRFTNGAEISAGDYSLAIVGTPTLRHVRLKGAEWVRIGQVGFPEVLDVPIGVVEEMTWERTETF